ncbi:MAG TPA: DUF1801 domain-containing protein [Polyangiaceae bacterium]|nr:DUF1801 domain-containing protein [Polyangiaceae bacterium]
MRKAKTIDAYLSTLAAERRAPLEKLRRTILSIVPKAEECISYGMPAFRLDGKVFAGFAATRKGFSYFPFSGQTLTALADEVADFSKTKGALHFDTKKHPLPAALVKKLIRARRAEIAATRGTKD